MKFKVGDKVKFEKDRHGIHDVNKIYTIKTINTLMDTCTLHESLMTRIAMDRLVLAVPEINEQKLRKALT